MNTPENSRRAVHVAVERGLLHDPRLLACSYCGRPAAGYDHPDYDAPLRVVPACASCNTRVGWMRKRARNGWAPPQRVACATRFPGPCDACERTVR